MYTKSYLLWTLKDILYIVNGSENSVEISFIQLYDFKEIEKQIVYQIDIPQISYFCEICESATLMGKTSKRYKRDHPIDALTL